MGANPHANGSVLLKPLELADFRAHAVEVQAPGAVQGRPPGSWATSCVTLWS